MAGDLFAPSPQGGSFAGASEWVLELLRGPLVTTLATLAVAFIGYEMLSGRISMRNALRVILGCFVLLGAPAIALGLMDAARDVGGPGQVAQVSPPSPVPPPAFVAPTEPPGANPFDPYAGNRRPD